MLEPGTDDIRKLFQQKDGVAMVNHGSYGLVPVPIADYRRELLEDQDREPDVWFRKKYLRYFAECIYAAAQFIGADSANTFLVDNATTGTNTVIDNLKWEKGDGILLTTHTYLAVKNTVQKAKEDFGINVVAIEIPIPIKCEEEVIDLYKATLAKHPNIKFAVIDHITSASGLLLPVKRLVEVCRDFKVLSFIDGAHAPGQVDIDVKDINADFYVGNFHKWCYASRGTAFLWISPAFNGKIFPLITSNHVGSFHERFGYMGTRDTSNYFTLPQAIKFHSEVTGGFNVQHEYADKMLVWAQDMLAKAFNTCKLDIPAHMRAPYMACVQLPPFPSTNTKELKDSELILKLFELHKVVVAVPQFNGKNWIRISCNVYNIKQDYIQLKDAILDFYQIA